MKIKVFISYVRENTEVIKRIDAVLTEFNIEVLTDYKCLIPGHTWGYELKDLISESDFFIIVFSKQLLEKSESYLYEELNTAISIHKSKPPGAKWIIPVKIDECEIPNIPIDAILTINGLHRVNLFPLSNIKKFKSGIKSIIESVKGKPIDDSEFEELYSSIDFEDHINDGFISYKNLGGSSGVDSYRLGSNFIEVRFSDLSVYVYTYSSAGQSHVEMMKVFAKEGKGLNSYIHKYVRKNYERSY